MRRIVLAVAVLALAGCSAASTTATSSPSASPSKEVPPMTVAYACAMFVSDLSPDLLTLSYDGRPDDPETFNQIGCILKALGAPSSVEPRMGDTRALDGTQREAWGDYTVTWKYHPDDGLDAVFSQAQ